MTGLVILTTGVWNERHPTPIELGGGDLGWVTLDSAGARTGVDAPEELVIANGEHIELIDAPLLAWHDVYVDELFLDEAMTVPFSGTIRPGEATAVTEDGTTYTTLYGLAYESGAPLTQAGFRAGLSPLGSWGGTIVVLAVLLFALSTAISWSYYGDRCANYLFGAPAVLPYKLAFVTMHFIGAVLPLTVIWNVGDIFLSVVIVPNLIALILLSPQVVAETRSYFQREPWRENELKHQQLKREGRL
jgi:AGCS family alanine or glycine:cation symporter